MRPNGSSSLLASVGGKQCWARSILVPLKNESLLDLHEQAQQNQWKPAPAEYWDRWRNECALADQIVVNSAWSRDALLSEGVPAEKIRVVTCLLTKPTRESKSFQRHYPNAFTSERPLRVLFLGQINLRKGSRAVTRCRQTVG